jgi:hypothetical protein
MASAPQRRGPARISQAGGSTVALDGRAGVPAPDDLPRERAGPALVMPRSAAGRAQALERHLQTGGAQVRAQSCRAVQF